MCLHGHESPCIAQRAWRMSHSAIIFTRNVQPLHFLMHALYLGMITRLSSCCNSQGALQLLEQSKGVAGPQGSQAALALHLAHVYDQLGLRQSLYQILVQALSLSQQHCQALGLKERQVCACLCPKIGTVQCHVTCLVSKPCTVWLRSMCASNRRCLSAMPNHSLPTLVATPPACRKAAPLPFRYSRHDCSRQSAVSKNVGPSALLLS